MTACEAYKVRAHMTFILTQKSCPMIYLDKQLRYEHKKTKITWIKAHLIFVEVFKVTNLI